MLFWRRSLRVDIFNAVYFWINCFWGRVYDYIYLSSQTEISSAGEQLMRDRLMTDRNVKKGACLTSSFDIFGDIFGGLYAFKNSSINFFFRSIDSPL
jgi:hypothetical protein